MCASQFFFLCCALELRRQNMQKRVSGQINNATKNTMGKVVGDMLSISVAEYEVRRVGLEMRGRKACENKLSINSWDGTWWLYWRRFRLKSPITEQCLLSLEISERILLNLSINIAVSWFGGLYTQPTIILFPWGTIISKKSDSITSGSENLHSSRSLYSRPFCK